MYTHNFPFYTSCWWFIFYLKSPAIRIVLFCRNRVKQKLEILHSSVNIKCVRNFILRNPVTVNSIYKLILLPDIPVHLFKRQKLEYSKDQKKFASTLFVLYFHRCMWVIDLQVNVHEVTKRIIMYWSFCSSRYSWMHKFFRATFCGQQWH